MLSPFPGMDPYLEDQGAWPGFHNALITHCSEALNQVLPDHYVAQMDERIALVDLTGQASGGYRPDVAVLREDRDPTADRPGGAAVSTLEPVTLPLAKRDLDEVREAWVEIRRLPDRRLVTVIEVLSPSNKVGAGRDEYLNKRGQLLDQPVHLVEIDLHFGGRRLPMGGKLPSGDYYAVVARFNRRPNCEVYAWSVRQPLPTIPVPLLAPDPDVPLDLAAVFTTTFERGRYARSIAYEAPLSLPLRPDDQAWAEDLARTRGR